MFDGKYFEWNQRRIKGIVDFYGYKFFYMKKALDLGCGYADMGGVLYRLGSDMTAVDARQEHLKIVSKKFPGIKVIQADLDGQWPFFGRKYDLVLDLGLLCHLSSYETHLKAVCASTSHLVLETAVCDSDDPEKCISVEESKGDYDLAYNGIGCRPSPAAIEKVLAECGMNFKRIKDPRYNSGTYTYDWAPQNDDSTSLNKRAIWIAIQNNSPIQFKKLDPSVLPVLDLGQRPPIGNVTAIKNSGVPVKTTASPRVPIAARTEPVERGAPQPPPPELPPQPTIILEKRPLELNAQVRKASREYSVIERDNYSPPINSPVTGIIFPTTHGSKMWCKKILPCFPGIQLFSKTLGVLGIPKSDQPANVVMCSVDNLQANHRIWIDEWMGPALTNAHIEVLKKCNTIITPSLLNVQEILKHYPRANIIRMARPWPLLQETPTERDHYLYFEKSEELTKLLFAAWNEQFGKLVVVGSSSKVLSNVSFVSSYEPYSKITKLLLGAKAVIDLSENNYYQSGILKLTDAVGIPIISNNHIKLSNGYTLINQDKKVSAYPTSENVRQAIQKFIRTNPGRIGMISEYNNQIDPDVRRILGV